MRAGSLRPGWTSVGILLATVALLAILAILAWQFRAGSVASAFDRPPAFPGYAWTRDGRAVAPEEMETIAGPSHCGWQSATMLFIAWPPGSGPTTHFEGRLYIRDPEGVFGARLRDGLARGVSLPADALSTGYRFGAIEIYVSPSDQDQSIYFVSPRDSERWPRMDPIRLCA